MAKWLRILDIRESWQKAKSAEQSIQALAKEISEKLAAMNDLGNSHVDSQRVELVKAFKRLSARKELTTAPFDALMDRLYDWADIPLDEKWNGEKNCWVET